MLVHVLIRMCVFDSVYTYLSVREVEVEVEVEAKIERVGEIEMEG